MIKLLFIPSLINNDIARLKTLLLILVVFYFCVLAAILLDLASGLEKAGRNGELKSSFGLRRTVSKIKDYFTVLMLFTISDVVASVWLNYPFFTAIGTIGIVFIEAKSVYENKKDINKGIKDLPDVLLQILKNKDKAEELLKILDENNRIEQTKNNKNG